MFWHFIMKPFAGFVFFIISSLIIKLLGIYIDEVKMKHSFKFILITLGIILAASCTPKTDIFVQPSGDAVLTLDIKTSPIMNTLIESISNFSEEEKAANKSIFNTEEIKAQLEEKGVKVLSIGTQSLAGISTKIKIFKEQMQDDNSFIKVDMKKGTLLFAIGPDNIKEFINMLSSDDREYVELLMAPALTGENITSEEYLEVIKSAYGEKLAAELKKSVLHVSVTCPKKVQNIKVTPFGRGQKDGTKASANIPLTEILCIQDPIFVEVIFTP